MKISLACLVLCSLAASVVSFKAGAPDRQCQAMRPWHEGSEPQTGAAPYNVAFRNKVAPGGTIQVTLQHNQKRGMFKGFMIQARPIDAATGVSAEEAKPVGTFSVENGINQKIKLLTCTGPNDTATHSINEARNKVNLRWTAPKDFTGDVEFIYTLVQDYVTYWVKLNSPPLTVAPMAPRNSPTQGRSRGGQGQNQGQGQRSRQ